MASKTFTTILLCCVVLFQAACSKKISDDSVDYARKMLQGRRERDYYNTVGGAVYTRWGRKDCPQNSKLLYEGVMGGSFYASPGGGANYLCLPLNPIYDKFKAGYQGSSYVYGAEYQVITQPNIFPTTLNDHDPVCAVCHAENRVSHVMIPARNVCPSGWTLEYKGYLMSAHHGSAGRTMHICVDADPTARTGTQISLDGAMLFFDEGFCGSLPCDPYVAGKELTCAVCTS